MDLVSLGKYQDEIEEMIENGDLAALDHIAHLLTFFPHSIEMLELKAKSEKLGFQIEIPQSFPNRVTLQAKPLAGK